MSNLKENLEEIINEIAEFRDCEIDQTEDYFDMNNTTHYTKVIPVDGVAAYLIVEGIEFVGQGNDRDMACKDIAHQLRAEKLDHIVTNIWEGN